MSFNREGIVWPTGGGWRYGQWACDVVGDDPEWDVEYLDHFAYVSPVMATQGQAFNAFDGANPGGFSSIEDRAAHEAECARLDKLAGAYDAARTKAKRASAANRYRPLGRGRW